MSIKKLLTISMLFSMNAMGQTWTVQGTNISQPNTCVADLSAVNDSIVWGISTVMDPGSGFCGIPVHSFIRTTNGGASWQPGNIPLAGNCTPTCISAVDGNIAYITSYDLFNGNSGKIYKTTNGGANWVYQNSAQFSDAARFIHFYNADEGVAVGDSSIFITSDGGTNWMPSGFVPTSFGGPTSFLLNSYEVLGNNIWLGDASGHFYKSTDRGHSWVALPQWMYPDAIKGIAFRDSLNGIAIASHLAQGGNGGGGYTDDGYIYHTSDGGTSWTTSYVTFANPSLNNATAKYDISYVPGTAKTYILTQEYEGDGYSAISTDDGNNWTTIDEGIKHTACAFASNGTGWSGGYYTSASEGMYKWNGTEPSAVGAIRNNSDAIICSPNPVADQLNVQFRETINNGVIEVSDATGKLVICEKIIDNSQHSVIIHTGKLSSGMYVLSVKTTAGRYKTKFIK